MSILSKYEAFRDAVLFQDNWRAAGLQSRPSIHYAQALYAQAAHETGDFKSNIYKNGRNLFGMKRAMKRPKLWTGEISGHAAYSSELDSLIDRMNWDAWHRINFQNIHDWLGQVQAKGYAADPRYKKLVIKWHDKLFNSTYAHSDTVPDKPKKQGFMDKLTMISAMALAGIAIIMFKK